jgi:argininosuccinate lyase
VGTLVRLCESRKLPKLGDLSLQDFNAAARDAGAADCCGQDVYDWLGAEKVVQRYRSYGNAGVTGFGQQIKAWRERLDGSVGDET